MSFRDIKGVAVIVSIAVMFLSVVVIYQVALVYMIMKVLGE